MKRRTQKHESGFALILVLWGLAALSLIAVALLQQTRQASTLALARESMAQANMLAEAAIERAILAIDTAPNDSAWPENGTPIPWKFAGGIALISIQDEAGKIDALGAPDLLLHAALKNADIEASRINGMMRAIRQTRVDYERLGPLLDIKTLEALGKRIGLSHTEVIRLSTVLTVRSGLPGFDTQVANPQTLRLLPNVEQSRIASFLAARETGLARGDAISRAASPLPAFTLRSPRGAFTVRVEACSADGFLTLREANIRRDAPGFFARLEERTPLTPKFLKNGCPNAPKHAA